MGKPVFVMRDTTERPEAIESGVAKLVGTDYKSIVKSVSLMLNKPEKPNKLNKPERLYYNPYGDGRASHRIVKVCCKCLKVVSV